MQHYQPGAVVMCCGADSIAGDRLGCWNLSVKGHADCITYVRSFGLPVLVLGGGGYTMRNVARCWCYETSTLLGAEIPDELPTNDYLEYYGPDYRLHVAHSTMENQNSKAELERSTLALFELLRDLPPAPGAQIQTGQVGTRQTPGDMLTAEEAGIEVDPDEADRDGSGGGGGARSVGSARPIGAGDKGEAEEERERDAGGGASAGNGLRKRQRHTAEVALSAAMSGSGQLDDQPMSLNPDHKGELFDSDQPELKVSGVESTMDPDA
jgi:hypothetical protein